MTNLDELERLHAAATPGEWRLVTDTGEVFADNTHRAGVRGASPSSNADVHCAVATHNALPGLIAELRALREVERDAAAYLQKLGGSWHATEHKLRNSLAKAAIAKVPK